MELSRTFGICFLLVGLVGAKQDCANCDRSSCSPAGDCLAGRTSDVCGCCDVCSPSLGQRCDLDNAQEHQYGKCGENLVCKNRNDSKIIDEGICTCEYERAVCGSDGVTYSSLCHLLESSVKITGLSVVSRDPCKMAPLIRSPPLDDTRQVGDILVLDCEVTGYPVPAITWQLYKPDGSAVNLPGDDSGIAVQVRGGPEEHMITGWVQVMYVTHENAGSYVCVATNSEGESRASASISISGTVDSEAEGSAKKY